MRDNAYSHFVSWAKVILPLAALALLSTLFLFGKQSADTGEIPYSTIEDIARQPRLSSPAMAGVSKDGDVFSFTAGTVRPDDTVNGGLTVDSIELSMTAPAGVGLSMTAGMAHIDTKARIATLDALVHLETTDGYLMETSGLIAQLADGTVETTAPLEVRAPYGAITAGHLAVGKSAEGQQQMVFNGGVRLVYQPQP